MLNSMKRGNRNDTEFIAFRFYGEYFFYKDSDKVWVLSS